MNKVRIVLVRERNAVQRAASGDPTIGHDAWPDAYLVPDDIDAEDFAEAIIKGAAYEVEVYITTADQWSNVAGDPWFWGSGPWQQRECNGYQLLVQRMDDGWHWRNSKNLKVVCGGIRDSEADAKKAAEEATKS